MGNELLSELENSLKNIKGTLKKLKQYSGNQHYKTNLTKELIHLKKKHLAFKSSIKKLKISKNKINELDSQILLLFTEESIRKKIFIIDNLEMFWPEIESEFESVKQSNNFQIPDIIPNNEHKQDLLEAIDCYNSNSHLACLVMCRRSFEGALASCYRKITNNEPVRDNNCPKCQKKIGTLYMGITSLHKWALNEGLYPDKFKSLGILVADLGAGGAHPPLKEFPRDPDVARTQIQNTATLLKLIYSNKKILQT